VGKKGKGKSHQDSESNELGAPHLVAFGKGIILGNGDSSWQFGVGEQLNSSAVGGDSGYT